MRDDYGLARRQLLDDGYCIVDGGLPAGKLEALRAWSDEWLRTTRHSPRWKYQGSDIHVSGVRNVSKRNSELPRDGMVDFLIEHPENILASLGLADFRSGGTFQIISKPAGAPALYWHQDWARWDDPISLSPWPQQVFLNWYLTDTSVGNGCLRVIPGSHRRRMDLHEHLVPAHEGAATTSKTPTSGCSATIRRRWTCRSAWASCWWRTRGCCTAPVPTSRGNVARFCSAGSIDAPTTSRKAGRATFRARSSSGTRTCPSRWNRQPGAYLS